MQARGQKSAMGGGGGRLVALGFGGKATNRRGHGDSDTEPPALEKWAFFSNITHLT